MGALRIRKIAGPFLVFLILSPIVSLILLSPTTTTLNYPLTIRASSKAPDVDLSDLPEIDYEGLEEEYYDPKYEMLIIAPNQEFADAIAPLKQWKDQKGVKTLIVSDYSQYSGTDAPEKIRNMIKHYYETDNIRWVLLAGDAQSDLLPIRYVYNPDVDRWTGLDGKPKQKEALGSEEFKPTDYYYADLTGTWDEDDDGYWGEAAKDNGDNEDEIEWIPDVYVGRLPANDKTELENMVNKTLQYETDPVIGDWMNRMLLGSGVSDELDHEKVLSQYVIGNYIDLNMEYTHYVEDINFTKSNFVNDFNEGYSTVFFAGHGSPILYQKDQYGSVAYENTDAQTSTNYNNPSLVYADACSTGAYDLTDNNVAESLIKRENNAGAIGVIAGLRVTWYLNYDTKLEKLNRGNAKLFWKEFFENNIYQPGKALYDSKAAYLTSDYYTEGEGSLEYDFERKNVLTYCLLGDPEVDIYTDKPKNAANPFTADIYEGQLVKTTVTNNISELIPYARVHLESADGKYFTSYADGNGDVEFRLLPQANEFYDVTITGHNLVPSYFNFTTKPDNEDPEVKLLDWDPKDATVSNNVCFDVKATDSHSGVEGVFVLLSTNNYKDYTYFRLANDTFDDKEKFQCFADKLDPGEYSFIIVGRDYANNAEILYEDEFIIVIPTPLTDYVLIVTSILILSMTGLSVITVYYGQKKYANMVTREEILNTL